MTPSSPPGGCNPDQILRTLCICHPYATEDREASLLWLLISKGRRLTVISLAFQGSWWPGPCSSCLSSWLGCCELIWTSGLRSSCPFSGNGFQSPFRSAGPLSRPQMARVPTDPRLKEVFGERGTFAYPCQGLCIPPYPGGAWPGFTFSFFSKILEANLLGASVAPGSSRSVARLCNSREEGPCHCGEGE